MKERIISDVYLGEFFAIDKQHLLKYLGEEDGFELYEKFLEYLLEDLNNKGSRGEMNCFKLVVYSGDMNLFKSYNDATDPTGKMMVVVAYITFLVIYARCENPKDLWEDILGVFRKIESHERAIMILFIKFTCQIVREILNRLESFLSKIERIYGDYSPRMDLILENKPMFGKEKLGQKLKTLDSLKDMLKLVMANASNLHAFICQTGSYNFIYTSYSLTKEGTTHLCKTSCLVYLLMWIVYWAIVYLIHRLENKLDPITRKLIKEQTWKAAKTIYVQKSASHEDKINSKVSKSILKELEKMIKQLNSDYTVIEPDFESVGECQNPLCLGKSLQKYENKVETDKYLLSFFKLTKQDWVYHLKDRTSGLELYRKFLENMLISQKEGTNEAQIQSVIFASDVDLYDCCTGNSSDITLTCAAWVTHLAIQARCGSPDDLWQLVLEAMNSGENRVINLMKLGDSIKLDDEFRKILKILIKFLQKLPKSMKVLNLIRQFNLKFECEYSPQNIMCMMKNISDLIKFSDDLLEIKNDISQIQRLLCQTGSHVFHHKHFHGGRFLKWESALMFFFMWIVYWTIDELLAKESLEDQRAKVYEEATKMYKCRSISHSKVKHPSTGDEILAVLARFISKFDFVYQVKCVHFFEQVEASSPLGVPTPTCLTELIQKDTDNLDCEFDKLARSRN